MLAFGFMQIDEKSIPCCINMKNVDISIAKPIMMNQYHVFIDYTKLNRHHSQTYKPFIKSMGCFIHALKFGISDVFQNAVGIATSPSII